MSKTTNRFYPEMRELTVGMVLDNQVQHGPRWSAVLAISANVALTPHTRNEWVKKIEVESGRRANIPTEIAERPGLLRD